MNGWPLSAKVDDVNAEQAHLRFTFSVSELMAISSAAAGCEAGIDEVVGVLVAQGWKCAFIAEDTSRPQVCRRRDRLSRDMPGFLGQLAVVAEVASPTVRTVLDSNGMLTALNRETREPLRKCGKSVT